MCIVVGVLATTCNRKRWNCTIFLQLPADVLVELLTGSFWVRCTAAGQDFLPAGWRALKLWQCSRRRLNNKKKKSSSGPGKDPSREITLLRITLFAMEIARCCDPLLEALWISRKIWDVEWDKDVINAVVYYLIDYQRIKDEIHEKLSHVLTCKIAENQLISRALPLHDVSVLTVFALFPGLFLVLAIFHDKNYF